MDKTENTYSSFDLYKKFQQNCRVYNIHAFQLFSYMKNLTE